MGFSGGSDGKASACNAGDLGSIPGSGRSPGEGNVNPLQHSCLENPMDGGAWLDTTERLHFHFQCINLNITICFPSGSVVKNLPVAQEIQIQSLSREDPLEKEMATHSSILVRKVSRTEEPDGLHSPWGLKRVGCDLMTKQ